MGMLPKESKEKKREVQTRTLNIGHLSPGEEFSSQAKGSRERRWCRQGLARFCWPRKGSSGRHRLVAIKCRTILLLGNVSTTNARSVVMLSKGRSSWSTPPRSNQMSKDLFRERVQQTRRATWRGSLWTVNQYWPRGPVMSWWRVALDDCRVHAPRDTVSSESPRRFLRITLAIKSTADERLCSADAHQQ